MEFIALFEKEKRKRTRKRNKFHNNDISLKLYGYVNDHIFNEFSVLWNLTNHEKRKMIQNSTPTTEKSMGY